MAGSERGRRRTARAAPAPRGPASAAARLLAAARRARRHALAHYSGFAVGAALETADGEIITGCNIENATFGLTMCAERVALFKALSDGRTAIRRVAIVAHTSSPTPPCGACRQLLWEFAGDIEIVVGNASRETARWRLGALLPLPFSRQLLAGRLRPLRRRRKPANPL